MSTVHTCRHTSNCLNRWLGVRLESLGAAATLMASLVAVEQRGGASNAGLVLSYAMQVRAIFISVHDDAGSLYFSLPIKHYIALY